jgi:hypothetical protein
VWTGGLGQAVTAGSGRAPQTASPTAWDTYLREAYAIRQVQLPKGLDGPFLIVGDLAPAIGAAGVPTEDLNAAAAAFIADNLGLFGLIQASDLRYSHETQDRAGRRYLTYHRYRGDLLLDRMEVVFHFQADGALFAVGGTLRRVDRAPASQPGEAPSEMSAEIQPVEATLGKPLSVTTPDNDPYKPELPVTEAPVDPTAPVTIMTETFEGAFPAGLWGVLDNNGATGGEVYWDDDDHRYYNGAWSAWCADGGADRPPTQYYPNNMDSWMIYGPFSLADAAAATVTFKYWNLSESGYDYVGWMASTNGINFYGYQISGDQSSWRDATFDISDRAGQPTVWLAFRFISDGSITNEGAYVDDILIQKTPAQDIRVSPASVSATQTANRPIFIELDYMVGTDHTHRPMAGVIDRIRETFAAAGYAAYIEVDDALPHTAVIPITTAGVSASPWVQNLMTTNFDHAGDSRYYYAIWGHDYSYNGGPTGSSGIADLPGRVHLVTLGSFPGQTGTFSHQVGTEIHEFGHNLGQRHGGADHENWKPNYVSIMNYHYQLEGIGPTLLAKGWTNSALGFEDFSHSHGLTRSLNENSLDENVGLGFARAIDWNCSGTITSGVVHDLQASNPCSAAGTRSYIYDFDNWTDLASQVRLGPEVETLWSEPCITWEEARETYELVKALRESGELPPEPDGSVALDKDGAVSEPDAAAGKSLVIYNDGDRTLNITGISSAATWLTWHPRAAFSIPAGGSQVVQLYFDFGAAPNGTTSSTLYIYSNDPDENPVAVPISITTSRPANDNCASAAGIPSAPSVTYSYTAEISQATTQADPSPTCGNHSHEKSVWFQFTPPDDGTVVADTIGTNFDTILSAWTGACGALTSAACDDDSGGSLTSRISMTVSAGVTYRFMASSYRGDGGTLMFHLVYTATTHRLTLATAGTGTGTVSATPTGTSCGAGCWDYVGAPVVSLIATPTSGSEFLGWSGDADCVDGSVTMSSNHSCVATFSRPRLRLSTAGTGSGTVGANPVGASCGANCWEYAYNTVVSLLQTPSPGSLFTGWSGHADCADGVVTMASSRSCTGNFIIEPVSPPNLLVSALTAAAAVPSGGTYKVKDTTSNIGAGIAGPSITRFYLSANATLDASDRVLGERPVPALGPGLSSGPVATVLTVPIVAPGKYYLLVKADATGAVAESNEDDNLRSKVIYVGPDLLISAFTAPASAAPGQLVSFSVTTKNAGKNPTGPTVTKVFYSTDGKLGAGDVELATRNVPGLGVNTTDVWAVAATIPAGAPAGTRYFFAVADYLGAQVESKETNNTKKKAFIVTP